MNAKKSDDGKMYLVKSSSKDVFGRVDTMAEAKAIVAMHEKTEYPGGTKLNLTISHEVSPQEDTSKWPERYGKK